MTVLSNDGQSWLIKLERIGEKSARNQSIQFSNLGHLIDSDMLKEQFRRLDGNKATGIDHVTKAKWGEQLDENVSRLLQRIRRGTYRPKPARITEIPKEDGSKRPLAISCVEDKVVQLTVSTILSRIYEPLFLPCSYGFRLGQSCHMALQALQQQTIRNWNGAVVEIDIRKYFNRIPHGELMELLRKDRFAAKLKGLRDFLWKNLNANRRQALNTVIRVVRGWINYHGISDNRRRIEQFIYQSRRILYKWFNRKGSRHPMTWERLNLILKMLGYPDKWKTKSILLLTR